MSDNEDASIRTDHIDSVVALRNISRMTHPFDGEIDLSTSTGVKLFNKALEIDKDASRISVSVENQDQIMTKLKSKSQKFRMNRYLRMPKTGTGVPVVVRNTRAGAEINYNAFGDHVKMLDDHTKITLEQVTAWAVYNWGRNTQTRIVTSPLVIGEVDFDDLIANIPEEKEYERLKAKLQYRIRSEMMAGIVQGIIDEDSWDLYVASEDSSFIFETEEGDTKVDGFVLLKKILMDIRPEIVVDVQDKEKFLETVTLASCGNNVQQLTRTMEKTWNEIKKIKPGTYDESRFLTQLFRALKTSTNDDFLRSIKNMGDDWIKSDPSITAIRVAADANQFYKTLVNTQEWNKLSEDKTKLIALTTKVADLSKKNQQLESKLKSSNGKNGGATGKSKSSGGIRQSDLTPEQLKAQMEWRNVKKGQTCTRDGADWEWCGIGHGTDGKGLYMPKGHDHAKWAENKKERDARIAAKRGQRDKAAGKGSNTSTNSSSNGNAKKLALSKHLTAALTTQIGISDADAAKFAEEVMKSANV